MTLSDSREVPAAAAGGPLAGLQVLELGQLIAGPFAGKTLSDLGADTIKIEPPGTGDPLRKWRLLYDGTSVWWEVQSRNKRSVAIDLRQREGQEIVRKRPGFGVVGEAMGGLRHLTGEPGRVTVRVGVSIGDTLSALHGTIGVLAALRERDRNGGRGQVVDVALYEAVFNCMERACCPSSAHSVRSGLPRAVHCPASRPAMPIPAPTAGSSLPATATASSSA